MSPWYLLKHRDAVESLRREFQAEVSGGSQPVSDCLPFARRVDKDDVAAFIVKDGRVTERVIDVHLTWRGRAENAGFPSMCVYDTIWAFLKAAIDDTAERMSEEEVEDLLKQ